MDNGHRQGYSCFNGKNELFSSHWTGFSDPLKEAFEKNGKLIVHMKRKVTKAKAQVIDPLQWQAFVDRYLFVLPKAYFKDLERLISGKKTVLEIPREVI